MVELAQRRLAALSVLALLLGACTNPFLDRVKGVVDAAKAPRVTLTVGSAPVETGGSYDFGAVTVGSPSSAVFTITNSGKTDLTLSGGSGGITVGGTNADQFSLPVLPSSSIISAGKSEAFTLSFFPTSGGPKSASVTIGTNDPSAGAYTFIVTGAGAATAPVFTPSPGTYSVNQSVVLSTATSGAAIHYTTDGSAPTIASPVYSAPIPVTGNGTVVVVKAFAAKSGMADSRVVTGTFTINVNVVSTPNFSPPLGGFPADQLVTINCATPGAAIYYTTDGSTPTTASAIFSAPILVAGNFTSLTIKALATKAGMTDSTVAQASYAINYPVASPPAAFPGPAMYTAPQVVTLTASGASIVYTIDGTPPTTNGNGTITHGNPFAGSIPVNVSMTIRAVAYGPGLTDSTPIAFPYTLQPLTPSFSPPSGAYSSDQTVTITCSTPGAVIRYTTDGSTPSSTFGTTIASGGSVLISATTTLRAIAYQSGWTDSVVRSGTYSILQPPTFPAPSGRIGWRDLVTINIVTPGSQIAYTTDGSTPATNGTGTIVNGTPVGSGIGFPLPFGTTTVKAIAYQAGFVDTAFVARTYSKPMFLYASSPSGRCAIAYSLDPATGTLSPASPGGIPAPPAGMAVDSTGRFLYLTDPSSSQVWGFAIDPATGALTSNGGHAAASPGAISIVDNGDVVYVANTSSGTIQVYSKDASGLLSDAGSVSSASSPVSIATDVHARFMYVAGADAAITGYALDASRYPSSPIPGTPFLVAGTPGDILIDSTGTHFWVANDVAGCIQGYAIDANTGKPTEMPGSPFPASPGPGKMAIDPSGKYLYVTIPSANTVQLFRITAGTGALTGVATYSTGMQPKGVRVDLSGKFVYVANSGASTISVFALNPTNGQLTPVGGPVSTPFGAPSDILITGTPK